MITNAQKQLLHIAKAKLGLEREMYEAILLEQAGVRSSLDLNNDSFDRVMRRLEELGFNNTAKRPRRSRRYRPLDPVTPEQQQLIAALYAELGWTAIARQIGFNKRQVKQAWPQTRNDANKVIEGLKVLVNRERGDGERAQNS